MFIPVHAMDNYEVRSFELMYVLMQFFSVNMMVPSDVLNGS